MKNLLRWSVVAIAIVVMVITVMSREYARVRLTIPVTLAIGLLVARWYTSQPQQKIHSLWIRCSQSIRLYYSLPVALTLVLALSPSLTRGHIRLPANHDELSYHLAADTFCHGRLANPTPQSWEHFESYHINMVPAYCSKYQPGMGLMLAVGQLLGNTYFGVLIALVCASLAMSWMYRYWLPLRWAFFASLLSCFPLCGNWGDFYFVGGPLAVAASAILLCISRQLDDRPLVWTDGIWLSFSLVIFFWTRPFEGGIVSAFLGIPLLLKQLHRYGIIRTTIPLLPGCLLVLIPALWFQVIFNHACTGSYTTLPYLLHEQEYGGTPLFLAQSQRPDMPVYQHKELKTFHHEMLDWYQMQRDPSRMSKAYVFKFGTAWANYYCLLWLLPIVALPELWRIPAARRLLMLWIVLMVVLIGMTTWFVNHYAAPGLPVWTLLIVMSIRIVRLYRYRGYPVGKFLCVLLVTAYCSQIPPERCMSALYSSDKWAEKKQEFTTEFIKQGGEHLVLVQYGKGHDTGREWVYNSADLPHQPVIWARSMGKEKDMALANVYSGRKVWLLVVNSLDPDNSAKLTPYP